MARQPGSNRRKNAQQCVSQIETTLVIHAASYSFKQKLSLLSSSDSGERFPSTYIMQDYHECSKLSWHSLSPHWEFKGMDHRALLLPCGQFQMLNTAIFKLFGSNYPIPKFIIIHYIDLSWININDCEL